MSIGIAGASSIIAREAIKILPSREPVQECELHSLTLRHDRYLICTGFLAGKKMREIPTQEAIKTFLRNFLEVAEMCDRIFEVNERARILVIGSESAYRGSYDGTYAGMKAALHQYVETKKLEKPEQMLVGLAPHIIWSSGMTKRRDDFAELEARGKKNRMQRWLDAKEVALEAVHLLYEASPSLSGQVIRMRVD